MDHYPIRFCEGLVPGETSQPASAVLEQLQALFQASAFWAQDRKTEDLALAIANSKPVISVWHQERLVGFARATSDGVYRATIWDVVVHPGYRGSGLGHKLVQTLLAHPQMNRVEQVYLMTTYQQSFYERVGFQRNSNTTMVLHNRPVLPIAVLPLTADISLS